MRLLARLGCFLLGHRYRLHIGVLSVYSYCDHCGATRTSPRLFDHRDLDDE